MTSRRSRGGPPRFPRALTWLVGSTTLSASADSFFLFVIMWLAVPEGWKGPTIALILMAVRGSALVGGYAGGRAIDLYGPRTMMVVDLTVRLTCLTALSTITWIGGLSVGWTVVLGGIAGIFSPISYAAARTLSPRLVEDVDLPRANSILSIGDQLPILLSALLVGPAVLVLGAGHAIVVGPVLLAGALALALALPRHTLPRAMCRTRGEAAVQRTRSPWSSLRVLNLVGLSVLFYFTFGPTQSVLPTFVRNNLDGGPEVYSMLIASFAVGGMAGLLLAPRILRLLPRVANPVIAVSFGLAMFFTLSAGNTPVSVVGFTIAGAIWGPYSAVESTLLARWTDQRVHGRLFGTQRAMLQGGVVVGAALGALALASWSAQTILLVASAACTVVGLASLVALRASQPQRPTSSRAGLVDSLSEDQPCGVGCEGQNA